MLQRPAVQRSKPAFKTKQSKQSKKKGLDNNNKYKYKLKELPEQWIIIGKEIRKLKQLSKQLSKQLRNVMCTENLELCTENNELCTENNELCTDFFSAIVSTIVSKIV